MTDMFVQSTYFMDKVIHLNAHKNIPLNINIYGSNTIATTNLTASKYEKTLPKIPKSGTRY